MKKNIFFVAIAALTLSLTACQKDDDITVTGGEVDSKARVKSTSDLNNTDWTAAISLSDLLGAMTGYDMGCIDSIDAATFESYLNFDGTYAHFTFSDNVVVMGLNADNMMQQITGVDYEYSYNGATHTGSLNGEDEDGNPTSLTFTYNDSTDAITFVLPLYVDGDTNAVNIPVVYNRAE